MWSKSCGDAKHDITMLLTTEPKQSTEDITMLLTTEPKQSTEDQQATTHTAQWTWGFVMGPA